MTPDRAFEIEILEQGWLTPDPPTDLCSHGAIRLRIGGAQVMGFGEGSNDVGISRTALALLRSLEADHAPSDPDMPQLVFHGCGFLSILGASCPIGADWSVQHADGDVRLGDVIRIDTTSRLDAVSFPEATVTIPFEQYRSQIVAFARETMQFFAGSPKVLPADPFDREDFVNWQSELTELLQKFSRATG
jgi:hypothetical protein